MYLTSEVSSSVAVILWSNHCFAPCQYNVLGALTMILDYTKTSNMRSFLLNLDKEFKFGHSSSFSKKIKMVYRLIGFLNE